MHEALRAIQNIGPDHVPLVDLHMHTTWTDGKCTALEMLAASVDAGLETVLFSEHARRTSGDWFGDFAREIRGLPVDSCRALVGVESKVDDFDGTLDCTEEIVELCDLVMGSVHRFPGETKPLNHIEAGVREKAVETEFKLAMALADNPAVDILGHPFGMCFRRFNVHPPESVVRRLMVRCAEKNVAFEINSRYHPDPWQWIEWCREAGAPISIGSNAHDRAEVGRIVRILRKEEAPWNGSAS